MHVFELDAVGKDTWPSNQLQEFSSLLLVQHEGQNTFKAGAALQLVGSA